MTRRRVLLGLLVVALLLGACGSSDDEGSTPAPTSTTAGATTTTAVVPPSSGRTALAGFGEVEVRIVEGPDGEPIVICVLVADTPEQRAQGLMGVADLGGYDGMLFRFEAESASGFWMKDTILPLSIAYLDADGAVVSTADMEPCPDGTACPSYPAAAPYRMALEVEQGGLAPLGLTQGSDARLEVVSDSCTPLDT
jgi:uncharacterized protein